jgi:hypothetical protein
MSNIDANVDNDDDGLTAYRLALATHAPSNSTCEQDKRAELRSRFLNVLEYLKANHQTSSPIELHFHRESSLIAARCLSVDSKFSQILVQDLHTPIGTLPTALIRASDLTALSFPLQLE